MRSVRARRNCGCVRLVHAVVAATWKRKNDGVAAHTVEGYSIKSFVERPRVVSLSVVTFPDVLLRRLYALCMGPQSSRDTELISIE